MSDSVTFTKNGLRAFRWDPDTQAYAESEIPSAEILTQLRTRCDIASGVTMADMFMAVQQFPALVEFFQQYSWCGSIDLIHAEGALPAPTAADLVGRMEISAWMDSESSGVTHDLFYVGPPTKELWPFDGTEVRYGVSLTPVNEMSHLPISLNPTLSVLGADGKELASMSVEFSLLEILDAIYYELSFHGGPEERDAVVADLQTNIAKIESGESELIPIEDIFRKEPIN